MMKEKRRKGKLQVIEAFIFGDMLLCKTTPDLSMASDVSEYFQKYLGWNGFTQGILNGCCIEFSMNGFRVCLCDGSAVILDESGCRVMAFCPSRLTMVNDLGVINLADHTRFLQIKGGDISFSFWNKIEIEKYFFQKI